MIVPTVVAVEHRRTPTHDWPDEPGGEMAVHDRSVGAIVAAVFDRNERGARRFLAIEVRHEITPCGAAVGCIIPMVSVVVRRPGPPICDIGHVASGLTR